MPPSVAQTARIFEDPLPPSGSPKKAHKRVPSVGDVLRGRRKDAVAVATSFNNSSAPSPLGERHINSPPSPKKIPLKDEGQTRPSMHKKTESSTSLKGFLLGREKSNEENIPNENQKPSEPKPKKTKSSTNLAGLLKRKSKRDLKAEAQVTKETQPVSPSKIETPIWAQYATQPVEGPDGSKQYPLSRQPLIPSPNIPSPTRNSFQTSAADGFPFSPASLHSTDPFEDEFRPPQRPYLEKRASRSSIFTENLEDDVPGQETKDVNARDPSPSKPPCLRQESAESTLSAKSGQSTPPSPTKAKTSRIMDVIATLNMRSSAPEPKTAPPGPLSPQQIDSELENMLGRYDIPQNIRDNLRNLKPEVKAGLVKGERIGSGSSSGSAPTRGRSEEGERPSSKDEKENDGKRSRSRSRARSRVFSMSKKSKDASPSKADGGIRSRSKSRPKSADMSARPLSAMSNISTTSIVSMATADSTATPGDFIHYLREVQKPELVEVGKIHKLRILLRNESVQWTDAFVRKGGMDEMVQLLYRIMKIEWREEHEDSLLHETLLCLKALATTNLAMQRLQAMEQELFPALLKMLFDPERKGPADFSTRAIIISLLLSHLSATLWDTPQKHVERTKAILGFLKDSGPEDGKQPLEFVTQMHTSRPYKTWCREVSNVTKEVFWIFLHHMNVVPITEAAANGQSFAHRHFPAGRAPHPAAPYVGGVEWEATQYLATHLDLINGLIVSLPTRDERNGLREDMRQSGFEKVMGHSLRTCKEKFYGGVHEGLRTWVASAKEDGWYAEDVRAGPPREVSSPQKSPSKGKKHEAPPRLDLHVGIELQGKAEDNWL